MISLNTSLNKEHIDIINFMEKISGLLFAIVIYNYNKNKEIL